MASCASGHRKANLPPAPADRRIKCTYKDCFRYFSNEKDLKIHKKREPSHEYCHKCDVDCEDDAALLIHMIESGKHIVCPICGQEFKSNAGLETHIPQTHQQSQNLECFGCKERFGRAAGLMHHIENDECKVITREIFERRRAERAVAKDAWAAQLNPQHEQNIPRGHVSMFSDADMSEHGGVSLLDENNLLESDVHSSTLRDYLTPSLNMLSLRDQYPTLPNLNPSNRPKAADKKPRDDLMSFEGDEVQDENDRSRSAWNTRTSAAGELFENSKSPFQPTNRNDNGTDGWIASRAPLSTQQNAHLSTQPARIRPASLLEPMNYFNEMTNKFECPGRKCGGIFNTIEAFNTHLISNAHVGGRTICPSCLARFSSTMSLIAHCESPSKKCNIRNSANYNQILWEITGGLIGTEGHHIDGSVRYVTNDITKPGYW